MPTTHQDHSTVSLEETIHSLIETYSPELSYRYELLKQRMTNPAVPAVNGACSGCCITLTKSQIIQLTHYKKIDVCENCGRLIYVEN